MRDDVLHALLARRTPFGLIATDETPADDPLEQPFHFSSHVLLWRVLRDLDPRAASEVQAATRGGFTESGRFAYAVRGGGGDGARHYHDANDLPTVFAPAWGFCDADDPVWRATIEFAWSAANEGYFAGALGGLGSLHTRHPWPLGDLQEIVVARVLADAERERRALERLETVETWDGLLPEAYDENDRRGRVAALVCVAGGAARAPGSRPYAQGAVTAEPTSDRATRVLGFPIETPRLRHPFFRDRRRRGAPRTRVR